MKVNGPGESSLLLLDVIKQLDTCAIPYAVVGAFAASFYGAVRASLDADAIISVEGNKKEFDRLLSLLKKMNFKITRRKGDSSDPVRGVINIIDRFQNRVDLLLGIRGMGADIFQRAVTTTFMSARINIISVEDFIAMKIFAGSAKDMADVRSVLQVSKKNINIPLCKKLTLRYGKKELRELEKILEE